jgi:hypothetical protein
MAEVNLEEILAGKVETTDSALVIKMPEDEPLSIGQHKFQLTVEDGSGNKSQPAQITVIIVDLQAPTALIDLQNEEGGIVTNEQISFGSGFILSGARSIDVGGSIAKYVWELIPQ